MFVHWLESYTRITQTLRCINFVKTTFSKAPKRKRKQNKMSYANVYSCSNHKAKSLMLPLASWGRPTRRPYLHMKDTVTRTYALYIFVFNFNHIDGYIVKVFCAPSKKKKKFQKYSMHTQIHVRLQPCIFAAYLMLCY